MNQFSKFILYPLKKLYFEGPDIYGYGPFWGGRRQEDICAQLTGVDGKFWSSNPNDCGQLLERKFVAFLLGLMMTLTIMGCFWMIHLLGTIIFYHFCFVKPLKEIVQQACNTTSSIVIKEEDVLGEEDSETEKTRTDTVAVSAS
jgi:hypothetical protein